MTPLLTICGSLGLAGFTWLAWELWRAPLIENDGAPCTCIDCTHQRQCKVEPELTGAGAGADFTIHSSEIIDARS